MICTFNLQVTFPTRVQKSYFSYFSNNGSMPFKIKHTEQNTYFFMIITEIHAIHTQLQGYKNRFFIMNWQNEKDVECT